VVQVVEEMALGPAPLNQEHQTQVEAVVAAAMEMKMVVQAVQVL
jgi:hypothetical protein